MAERTFPPARRPPPTYRPPPPRKHRRRGCLCWLTILLLSLLLLAAIAGGLFYLLLRPRRPTFAISSLGLTRSSLNVSITVRNTNSRIGFAFDPISIAAGELFEEIEIPGFVQPPGNATFLKGVLGRRGRLRERLTVEIGMETKARIAIGGLSERVRIGVSCPAVHVSEKARTLSTSASVCRVHLMVKIWNWVV